MENIDLNLHIKLSINNVVKMHQKSIKDFEMISFGLESSSYVYSEKATKFCKIFTFLLSPVVLVKSKVKILQNFVAFSEYTNFTYFVWYITCDNNSNYLLGFKKDMLTKNQEKIVSSLE